MMVIIQNWHMPVTYCFFLTIVLTLMTARIPTYSVDVGKSSELVICSHIRLEKHQSILVLHLTCQWKIHHICIPLWTDLMGLFCF